MPKDKASVFRRGKGECPEYWMIASPGYAFMLPTANVGVRNWLAVNSCPFLHSYYHSDIRYYTSYQGHRGKSRVARTTWVKQGKSMTPAGKKKLPEAPKEVYRAYTCFCSWLYPDSHNVCKISFYPWETRLSPSKDQICYFFLLPQPSLWVFSLFVETVIWRPAVCT